MGPGRVITVVCWITVVACADDVVAGGVAAVGVVVAEGLLTDGLTVENTRLVGKDDDDEDAVLRPVAPAITEFELVNELLSVMMRDSDGDVLELVALELVALELAVVGVLDTDIAGLLTDNEAEVLVRLAPIDDVEDVKPPAPLRKLFELLGACVTVIGIVTVEVVVAPGTRTPTSWVMVDADGVTVTGNVMVCVTLCVPCGSVNVCTRVEVTVEFAPDCVSVTV